MRRVAVLGSTGSIGTQALDVIRRNCDLKVVAISAGRRWEDALAQAREFEPEALALSDPEAAARAQSARGTYGLQNLKIIGGEEAVQAVARWGSADVVLHAVPGFDGIGPLLASLEESKRVAFAGKESLVSAGDLVASYIRKDPERFIPVDSEHSAIFQCLLAGARPEVSEIVLTASGGALRDKSYEEMRDVSPEEVLRHPTWKMGKKVTIDSATLFNKALEVMEAHYLFGVGYDRIKVVLHRQSIVHSMVTFRDGSTVAQMARPDMRLAISYALTYPERCDGVVPSLSPYTGTLSFEEIALDRFPALSLGYRAGRAGGTAPCAVSAADELLVELYLDGSIGFLDIYGCMDQVLREHKVVPVAGTDVLIETRDRVKDVVNQFAALRRR